MFSMLAQWFGYVLNFLYEIFNNYGLALIIFSVLIKLLFLPISIKQQKTMKKSAKVQAEMQKIQAKYKNNPEKMNQEVMDLYKREKMSPFSGCLSGIVQIVLLFAVFYLVRSPLTYMKKVDPQIVQDYIAEIKQENPDNKNMAYPEIEVIEKKGAEDPVVSINMDFLGIDLSKVPTQSLNDPRVYVIPILYVVSSFISMRMTTSMQTKKKEKESEPVEDQKESTNELDTVTQMNKSMSWMMPIMSVSIAVIAPLGLALYWLVNNILMIAERLILNKILKDKGEDEE